MDTTSPLLQAVRADTQEAATAAVEAAVVTPEQMTHLLTLMITVSAVSILVLIFSVTIILGFLW